MKKQLLVLVLACSAIGSAFAGEEEGTGGWAKLNHYRLQYARPALLIKGIAKTTLGGLSAFAAWKNLTEGTGNWHPFDHDFHFNLRHLFIANSAYFIPNGVLDICKSTFGWKRFVNGQEIKYRKLDRKTNPENWKDLSK